MRNGNTAGKIGNWSCAVVLISAFQFFSVSAFSVTPTPKPTATPVMLSVQLSLAWDDPNPASAGVTGYEIYEQVGTAYKLLATVKPPTKTWMLPASLTSSAHAFVVRAVSIRGPGTIASTSWARLPAIPGGISNMRIEVKARLQ